LSLNNGQSKAFKQYTYAEIAGDFLPLQLPLTLANSFLFVQRNNPQDQTYQLIVPRELAQLDGTACNKIGVSYNAFNLNQANACNASVGSCLLNQLKNLRDSDIQAIKSSGLPKYILPSWGLTWSNTIRQLKLPVTQMQNTLLRLEVDA
jgi:hypothetical protein